MSGPQGPTGLYQVKAESGNPVARLIPVVGTIYYFERGKPTPPGTFLLLWGADGNQLVVRRLEDTEFPVSWVNILQTDSTD
jgi:hypothetical protein